MRPTSDAARTGAARALAASTAVVHEVYRNGVFTGRSFNSMMAAQRYADAVGGKVHVKSSSG